MPTDFDDDDLADVVEELDKPVPAARNYPTDVPEVQDETEDFMEQMSEVEARLEMAQYYRLLLNDSLFGEVANPEVAERVEAEIRGFVKSRMQVLVGVGEPVAKAQPKIFTDAEVQALRTLAQPDVSGALKALAAKVLKKPAILEAKPLPVEKPKAPVPVLKEPILRKVSSKPGARQAATAAPTRTPARAPQKSAGQKRDIRTNVNAKGEEFKQDVTPQARPQGLTIQPIPTPRTREQIEQASSASASYQASVALNNLTQKLHGKG